jgi:hypothetical protein
MPAPDEIMMVNEAMVVSATSPVLFDIVSPIYHAAFSHLSCRLCLLV